MSQRTCHRFRDGWAWAQLGSIADVGWWGDRSTPKRQDDPRSSSAPYLRVANVQSWHRWTSTDVHDDPSARRRGDRSSSLRRGDVLVQRRRRPRPARTAAACGTGQIARLHPPEPRLPCPTGGTAIEPTSWCSCWSNSVAARLVRGPWQADHEPRIAEYRSKLKSFPVPIAPPLRSSAGSSPRSSGSSRSSRPASERSTSGLARSAALRRSVLKAAFEGRLVPQDPTDEPASVLLERIRAERAAAPKRQARGRGNGMRARSHPPGTVDRGCVVSRSGRCRCRERPGRGADRACSSGLALARASTTRPGSSGSRATRRG